MEWVEIIIWVVAFVWAIMWSIAIMSNENFKIAANIAAIRFMWASIGIILFAEASAWHLFYLFPMAMFLPSILMPIILEFKFRKARASGKSFRDDVYISANEFTAVMAPIFLFVLFLIV